MSTLAVSSDAATRQAPDAVAPPPGNPRFPLFDGLRAIAALSIVVTHCSGLTGFNQDNPLGALTARLDAGVALFFVMSGFLLYRPFLAARFEGRRPRIRDYARRRLLRIVPAYWAALTVLGLTVGLSGVFTSHWWVYYGFAQVYFPDWVLGGIGPAWSLCVEMSFYLALPFFAVAMARIGRKQTRAQMIRTELSVLVTLGVLSLAVRAWSDAHPGSVLNNTLLGYADWFAVGMGLALASAAAHGREQEHLLARTVASRPWIPWMLAAACFLLAASPWLDLPRAIVPATGVHALIQHVLYVTVGGLLVLPAIFGDPHRGLVRRFLALRAMTWLRLISYGVFLWHAPLMIHVWEKGATGVLPGLPFVSLLLVTAGCAVACAALSYFVVEKPILRFKDRRRPSRPPEAVPAPANAG